jgi:hypothetical protein
MHYLARHKNGFGETNGGVWTLLPQQNPFVMTAVTAFSTVRAHHQQSSYATLQRSSVWQFGQSFQLLCLSLNLLLRRNNVSLTSNRGRLASRTTSA